MARYTIWDKKSDVYVPTGAKFTAEQWIEQYPIAEVETVKVVCAGGVINGAFFGILSEMVDRCEKMGCDFTACETDQDYLDKIEAFEDELNTPSTNPTTEERTAAALEAIADGQTTENTQALNILLTGEEL